MDNNLDKVQDGSNSNTQENFVRIESFIQRRLQEEKARLEKELGIEEKPAHHFHKPIERPFTRSQRLYTTVLYGGLTWKHEHLVHGALEGLGYNVEYIPTADKAAFQLGKEYGNNGQCNPTYFTVGNLVQYLQKLEWKGLSKQEIIDKYIFVTAGACGPCRFGMYEAEYRLALRNSGFDGFRVILFQQSGGLNQADEGAGLEMNMDFFFGMLNGMNMGETDRVLAESMDYLHEVLKKHKPFKLEGKIAEFLKKLPKVAYSAEYIGKFLTQIYGDEYTAALREVGYRFNSIEVDRTRIKPIVKVTGEFWAQTTEGDGNFNMFNFLEREGAQVLVEPIGTWIMYMIHQAKQAINDKKGLTKNGHDVPGWWRLDQALSNYKDHQKKIAMLTAAEIIFKREWNRMRESLGNLPHDLTDQYELQRLGHPFYNSRAGGGEGHLEVAKNIYYSNKDLAHMVLSLKPFGCMPSTQSDGAQAAVVSAFKDIIYLPVETSGEGEINAHSRVQMALGEAKNKAKLEFQEVLARTGLTLDDCRAYVDAHPDLKRPFYHIPHYKGMIGVSAGFVRHVRERMKTGKRHAA